MIPRVLSLSLSQQRQLGPSVLNLHDLEPPGRWKESGLEGL